MSTNTCATILGRVTARSVRWLNVPCVMLSVSVIRQVLPHRLCLQLFLTLVILLLVCAAVAKDFQDQAGLGQEGQAEQTYPSVDQIQDRKQD